MPHKDTLYVIIREPARVARDAKIKEAEEVLMRGLDNWEQSSRVYSPVGSKRSGRRASHWR